MHYDPRIVGGTYRSAYWQQTYVVNHIQDLDGVRWYTVTWEDGHMTHHCTVWDKRDTIIAA